MHPDADIDTDTELALRLLRQPGYVAGDLQSRVHSAAHIVLVGIGVTEYRQQPIAFG